MASVFSIKSKPSREIRRLAMSFSNVSRNAFTSLVGLALNYVLLHDKSPTLFNSYVYCISLLNFALVFTNWGGKDFLVNRLSNHYHQQNKHFGLVVVARLLLLLPIAASLAFLPASPSQKIFLFLLLGLRTLVLSYEALITVNKKFHLFLVIDFLINLVVLLTVWIDRNTNSELILFAELLGAELLRLVVCMTVFRQWKWHWPGIKQSFIFIGEARFFFYMGLAGFICSKADLYVATGFLQKNEVSSYFVLLNLTGFAHVSYTAIVNTFSSGIFRFDADTFKRFSSFTIRSGLAFSIVAATCIYLLCNYYYRIEIDVAFALLMFANIFLFTQVLTAMYRYTRINRQKQALFALLVSGGLNISLSAVLCGPAGIIGAFVANTVCQFSVLILLASFSGNDRDQRINSHV